MLPHRYGTTDRCIFQIFGLLRRATRILGSLFFQWWDSPSRTALLVGWQFTRRGHDGAHYLILWGHLFTADMSPVWGHHARVGQVIRVHVVVAAVLALRDFQLIHGGL